MQPYPTVLFVLLGAAYALLMILHECFVLPFLRSYFAAGGGHGARKRQRKFEWACRQAVSYFYALVPLQSLRHLPIPFGPDFGLLVTGLQIGAFLLGLFFSGWLGIAGNTRGNEHETRCSAQARALQ